MKMKAWVLFAPILLLLGALFAPPAWGDTYTDQLVGKFNAQTHVVADNAAKPPLRDPAKLNKQILTSRFSWSPTPPVWVAVVAPNQTGVTTPDAIHNAALARNPKFSGVILVIDSKGYHVRAYNVPQVVANSVDNFMGDSAKANKGNVDGATSAFVSKLAGINTAGGPSSATSPTSSTKHTSWTWLWVTLAIIGVIILTALLAYFIVKRLRRQREDELAREAVKAKLIDAESGVNDLSVAMLAEGKPDVSAEYNKSSASLADAKAAYRSGDYTSAKAHIKAANDTVARGKRKLSPASVIAEPLRYQDTPASPKGYLPDVDAVKATPKSQRRRAAVNAIDPSGNRVTINNNNYSTTRGNGYDHYYGGGMYNGVYFYPGYYPYNYWGPGWGWSPTDILLMDVLLDDHWGGNYGGGYDSGYDSAQADTGFDGGDTNDYDSTQADVGFDGDSQDDSDTSDTSFDGDSGDSGGGDVDFGGDSSDDSSSSTSDYSYSGSGGSSDSGSSFDYSGGSSSSDSGGSSFDFGGGGGGFDSGGGGFDSGGGGGFDF